MPRSKDWYSIPLNFTSFIEDGKFLKRTTSKKDSIDQHIHMIFWTSIAEFRYDRQMGVLVSQSHLIKEFFNNSDNTAEQLKSAIEKSIINREERLTSVEINIDLSADRDWLKVEINGRYRDNRETYSLNLEIS